MFEKQTTIELELLNKEIEASNHPAKLYLQLLDPRADSFTFQVFDDVILPNKKKRRDPRLIKKPMNDTLKACSPELTTLNKQGACISVCINRTNLKGRTESDITDIRAVWCDYDSEKQGVRDLEELINQFPIYPSMVVCTSPGNYHFYFLVDGAWPCDDKGISDFDGIIRTIISHHYSDKGTTGIHRAMRLPGFNHMKDKDKPYPVKIIDVSGNRYTRENLLYQFPPIEKREPLLKETTPRNDQRAGNTLELNNNKTDWQTEKPWIIDALSYFKDGERNEYLVCLMTVYALTDGSPEGKEVAHNWVKNSLHYDTKGFNTDWKSSKDHTANLDAFYQICKAKGWPGNKHTHKERPFNPVKLPPVPFGGLGPIAHAAHAKMRKAFPGFDHKPSDDQYIALAHIMMCCEAIIKSRWTDDTLLENKFYLSSLDPGIGKSKAFCHFIAQFLKAKEYKRTGIMICVSGINEVESLFYYLRELGVPENYIGVHTGKGNKVNELGNKDYTRARVLLTTQQMIDARVKRTYKFSDLPEFHYSGRARALRIWDEAILPGRQLTINIFKIYSMLEIINNHNGRLAETLDQVIADIKQNTVLDIPNFKETHDISEGEARDWFKKHPSVKLDEVSTLWQMSGKTVNAVQDQKGKTALSYVDTLPDDMKPLLVLDASGRVRHAYEDWANSRKDIVVLYPGTDCIKDYSKFTVHVWNQPGGKNQFTDNPGLYAEAICEIINSKMDEQFLVVHYINMKDKKGREINFKGFVDAMVEGDKARVNYIHWGDHSATNSYAHIPNCILAGTYFQPQSHYHSLYRLATKAMPHDDIDKAALIDIKNGENAHGILQASCRTRVRKSDGSGCPESNLYVIGETRIAKLIDVIFPGCVTKEWKPSFVKDELTPKQLQALDYILYRLTKIGDKLSFEEVQAAIEINDRANFRKLVVNDIFRTELKKHGIIIQPGSGRSGSYFDKQLDRPLF